MTTAAVSGQALRPDHGLTLLAGILSALTYAAVSFAVGRPRAGRLVLCFLSIAYSGALLLVTGFLSAWFQLPN